jgi:heptosyltransferase-2/heptosyltransferase-3
VKQWPLAAWAEVAENLAAAYQVRIALTGDRSERKLTAGINARLTGAALDLAGQTTVGQLAALYARAALVLGSDSGPLHLAVAVGAPTVHLYGPIPPAKFGPWGDPARHTVLQTNWPCAPCDRLYWPPSVLPHHACMAAITPAAVLQAAGALLR